MRFDVKRVSSRAFLAALALLGAHAPLSPALGQQVPLQGPSQAADQSLVTPLNDPGAVTTIQRSPSVGQSAEKPTLPSMIELVMLARSTLVAVSQANEANDYSVLHALAGPQLRASATKEQLGEALTNLRARDIDLAPVTVIVPSFSPPPFIDDTSILRMSGVFPTEPLQVRFALSYRNISGVWRLEGLAIDTTPAPAGPAPQVAARGNERARASTAQQAQPAGQATAAQQRPRRATSSTAELDRRTDPPTTTRY